MLHESQRKQVERVKVSAWAPWTPPITSSWAAAGALTRRRLCVERRDKRARRALADGEAFVPSWKTKS
jgi:hypothetical protein